MFLAENSASADVIAMKVLVYVQTVLCFSANTAQAPARASNCTAGLCSAASAAGPLVRPHTPVNRDPVVGRGSKEAQRVGTPLCPSAPLRWRLSLVLPYSALGFLEMARTLQTRVARVGPPAISTVGLFPSQV